jgi:hypothetical protein
MRIELELEVRMAAGSREDGWRGWKMCSGVVDVMFIWIGRHGSINTRSS